MKCTICHNMNSLTSLSLSLSQQEAHHPHHNSSSSDSSCLDDCSCHCHSNKLLGRQNIIHHTNLFYNCTNCKCKSNDICSGIFLKLQEYFTTSKLFLYAYVAFENCSECNTSGCDAWESVVKICQYLWHEINY